MTKTIAVPLGYFALPVPRKGSIEAQSGFGNAAAQGLELHGRVQRARAKSDPDYQAEVPVTRCFERGGYQFQVNGRMDGIFRGEKPRIEEIKTSFSVNGLARRLADQPLDHPYGLQLASYGYFHWLEHGILPELTFHLVSTRSGASLDLGLDLDLAQYQQWLDLRLEELVLEAERAEKRAARRRRAAGAFAFPFAAPRAGQQELMREIREGMAAGLPMLIQAPTGLGKTVGVLYPVLGEALGRGQQVVYLTPKNSQHHVAEDAVQRFREAGAQLKSLSITAKAKICLKEEPLCTPEYCEYARDHYGKLARHDLAGMLARKKKLTARHFRKLAQEYQVCPFELQLEAVAEADVVVCDYNYVFAPRSALGRVTGVVVDQAGKPNLVIDEAHNLPARSMDYYSPALSLQQLSALREELAELAPPFVREAVQLLERSLETLAACGAGRGGRPAKIAPPVAPFTELDGRLRLFLTRYLDSSVEIRPGDPLLRLARYWSEFTEALELAAEPEHPEFCTTVHPRAGGGTIKVTCSDASAMLKECYTGYAQVVAFSATLKPFDYYARLSGLNPERLRVAEFASPFPRELRKLLIIPQVSTRYSDRERNYAKIADAIVRIASLRRGNYLAFFPSFQFLDRVADLLRVPPGFELICQERNQSQSRCQEVLEGLRQPGSATMVFAVQGGSFAEGLDYRGDMLIGAFVVGPPLPTYDLEREQMREYYQLRFGAGFDYAYAIPAMAKAVQSAGRVIRSETDRGLIVLMDSRFLEPGYSKAMPADWFGERPEELVSEGILREVEQFWLAVSAGEESR